MARTKIEPAICAGPVFGYMLRAARLRWCYVASRNCFLRVSEVKSGPHRGHWRMELAPNRITDLTDGGKGTLYRVLDAKAAEAAMDSSPALRHIRSVKRAFELVLDDADGRRVV